MKSTPSKLILKNKTQFPGYSPSWQTDWYSGEVVFTTGMTGYVETLTDPSYAGQIIVFTYPLIGNYGVPAVKTPRWGVSGARWGVSRHGISGWESNKIHAAGVVVSEACENWSHADGKLSLLEWLKEQKVPIITGVDTRALTKMLREYGVMLGAINTRHEARNTRHETRNTKLETIVRLPITNYKFIDPNKKNLVAKVSCKKKKTYGKGKKIIFAVDCGMKESIMRELKKFDLTIHRVPYNYDYTKEKFDGVVLSNGPGDPMMANETIEILKRAMKFKKPIFGICLGSQLMGLAAGAKTYKLPYGHRGQNQPVIETATKRCYITSQNHGYAVNEKSLPRDWRVNFRNLNDGSVEGVAHKRLPFFSVQFHPEAAPGPTDTARLFRQFYELL
ncbi:MAG: glutamine-hydrolyzing carbamoyl-phosphate synthase small subunit [Patescibacteria group bacterium]